MIRLKKLTILAAILYIGALCACKDEDFGRIYPLELNPKYLNFGNRGDTAIVSVQSTSFNVSYSSEAKYISHTDDTLYDGWIKIVTLPKQKEVKVIVYDNDTGYGRYYIAGISGFNSGGSITIFQSANQEPPL